MRVVRPAFHMCQALFMFLRFDVMAGQIFPLCDIHIVSNQFFCFLPASL